MGVNLLVYEREKMVKIKKSVSDVNIGNQGQQTKTAVVREEQSPHSPAMPHC